MSEPSYSPPNPPMPPGAPPPAAPPPGPTPGSPGTRAIVALVLGIVSIVFCCLPVGPVAWFLGGAELKAIRAGLAPAAGEGIARASQVLGIVGTVLMLLGLLWFLFWGGMAVVGALAGAG